MDGVQVELLESKKDKYIFRVVIPILGSPRIEERLEYLDVAKSVEEAEAAIRTVAKKYQDTRDECGQNISFWDYFKRF